MSIRILLVREENAWGPKTEEVLRRTPVAGDLPETVTATSGEEAISLAAEEPFDLAIVDIVLPRPGISGAYTLLRIREFLPDCRSILVSHHSYIEDLISRVADAFIGRTESPTTSTLGRQLWGVTNELLGDQPPKMMSPKIVAGSSQEPTMIEDPVEPLATPQRTRKLIAAKYRLGAKLGQGAMGEVYRAEDTFIHREVAVKMLRMQSSSNVAELRRRMHREVMIAGSLAHPNIVTVHDAGFDGEDIYLVMALVDGQTLRTFLENHGPLPRAKALEITKQILAGLGHAHEKGVIHRDLKPANVLMAKNGTVKVADFGLAKIRSMAATKEGSPPSAAFTDMTAIGAVLGTIAYMAPEQMLGRPSDPRADLYTLGTLLFEMLHGRALARCISTQKRAACLQLGRQPPGLPELAGEPELNRILKRALALHPEDRYQDGASLAAELRALEP